MTQEDKNLLLKDLCARLPYGVMCDRLGHPLKLVGVHPNKEFALEFDRGEYMPTEYTVEDVKPYLRPMSSMTEKEREELCELCEFFEPYNDSDDFSHYGIEIIKEFCVNDEKIPLREINYKVMDWLNTNHFDYRGLIPMGLALEALESMYKEESK